MGKLKLVECVNISFRRYLVLLLFALIIATPVQAETVNINKADAATLQHYLTGVGAVKAEAIVAYRNKHGKFKSVDDLKNVSGIGDATVKKNRNNISVSKGVTRLSSKNAKAGKAKTSNKSKPKNSNKG